MREMIMNKELILLILTGIAATGTFISGIAATIQRRDITNITLTAHDFLNRAKKAANENNIPDTIIFYEESLRFFRMLKNTKMTWIIADTLGAYNSLAKAKEADESKEYGTARRLYKKSLDSFKAAKNTQMAQTVEALLEHLPTSSDESHPSETETEQTETMQFNSVEMQITSPDNSTNALNAIFTLTTIVLVIIQVLLSCLTRH